MGVIRTQSLRVGFCGGGGNVTALVETVVIVDVIVDVIIDVELI